MKRVSSLEGMPAIGDIDSCPTHSNQRRFEDAVHQPVIDVGEHLRRWRFAEQEKGIGPFAKLDIFFHPLRRKRLRMIPIRSKLFFTGVTAHV